MEKQMWHGIPREEIPWFPKVDHNLCIGCGLCYVTCGRGVFEMRDKKSVASHELKCMVGCSTCATVCPVNAISFPDKDLIWRLEREHSILKLVKSEVINKQQAQEVLAARAEAEKVADRAPKRVKVEVAGSFGTKEFLTRLQHLVETRPFDFVNLTLSVPTVKGTLEGTPSYMTFEVTSTEGN
ncbi:MAG: 4Fe-4S dicluster-binding protein [Bacillota bacterium]